MTERTREDLGEEVVALRDSYRVLSNKVIRSKDHMKRADDQLEILRRSAERGKKLAESTDKDSIHIDLYQHILDEIQRTGNAISAARGEHQSYG